MTSTSGPSGYEAWYHTPRGQWIAWRESELLLALMQPSPGETLLDVGCGTGHFSRRFYEAGLTVTGVEPDLESLRFARAQGGAVEYLAGDARNVPFVDGAFAYCTAVTSLCFVDEPKRALAEMWRVCRKGLVLGLLNRHSLLHRRKQGSGGYAGARWDTWPEVRGWIGGLSPPPARLRHGTAVIFPGGNWLARGAERLLPRTLPWGGFLAVYLEK